MHARTIAIRLGAATLAVAAVCALGACSSPSSDSNTASGSNAVEEETAAQNASEMSDTSRAIVLHVQNGAALFADERTQSVYFPTIPEDDLIGLNGQRIAADELQPGNIVEVTGNNIMLESYPGQYPGIAQIKVVETGDPAAVAAYQEVIDQVFAEPDPYVVAEGTLSYTTPLASVAVMLSPVSAQWDMEGGGQIASDGAVVDADGTVREGVADARITEPCNGVVSFSHEASAVDVSCQAISTETDGTHKTYGPEQPVSTIISTQGAAFTMEPGYLYTIYATFAH